MNTARRKRAREARRIVTRLTEMRDRHDIGDMERREGLEDVRWVKAPSRNTKQSMMARVSRNRTSSTIIAGGWLSFGLLFLT